MLKKALGNPELLGCVGLHISALSEGPADEFLFDFFQRGPDAGPERDGYGIGLHVVRRLVRMLDGSITVESTPGLGSCFRIALPLVLGRVIPQTDW